MSWRLSVHRYEIMVSPGDFLYFPSFFFFCKYWNTYIFYWPTSTVFLISSCFSSSPINAKQKFWGVPHLLQMCVIFHHIKEKISKANKGVGVNKKWIMPTQKSFINSLQVFCQTPFGLCRCHIWWAKQWKFLQ